MISFTRSYFFIFLFSLLGSINIIQCMESSEGIATLANRTDCTMIINGIRVNRHENVSINTAEDTEIILYYYKTSRAQPFKFIFTADCFKNASSYSLYINVSRSIRSTLELDLYHHLQENLSPYYPRLLTGSKFCSGKENAELSILYIEETPCSDADIAIETSEHATLGATRNFSSYSLSAAIPLRYGDETLFLSESVHDADSRGKTRTQHIVKINQPTANNRDLATTIISEWIQSDRNIPQNIYKTDKSHCIPVEQFLLNLPLASECIVKCYDYKGLEIAEPADPLAVFGLYIQWNFSIELFKYDETTTTYDGNDGEFQLGLTIGHVGSAPRQILQINHAVFKPKNKKKANLKSGAQFHSPTLQRSLQDAATQASTLTATPEDLASTSRSQKKRKSTPIDSPEVSAYVASLVNPGHSEIIDRHGNTKLRRASFPEEEGEDHMSSLPLIASSDFASPIAKKSAEEVEYDINHNSEDTTWVSMLLSQDQFAAPLSPLATRSYLLSPVQGDTEGNPSVISMHNDGQDQLPPSSSYLALTDEELEETA